MVRGHQAEQLKQQADQQAGERHRRVGDHQQVKGHPPTVVLPVDVDDGDDDQVGKDKRDHAAEADSPVPEHRGQRDVADRADKAEERDQGADQRSPDLGEHRMTGQKEPLPERCGHPGGERAGDQEAEANIGPHGRHVHPEVVTHGGQAAP